MRDSWLDPIVAPVLVFWYWLTHGPEVDYNTQPAEHHDRLQGR